MGTISPHTGNPTRHWRAAAALLAVIALAVWAVIASVFTVDVTQYALVTRFGAVLRVLDQPGLHVKAPFDTIVTLDKSLTFSRPAPAEYLSIDKKNVMVETLVTWRIAEPQRYLVTVATRAAADIRLADVLLGEVGAVLGAHPAAALIAPDGNAERFGSIVAQIREQVAAFARGAYGIEILDVQLVRLSLPEQNRAPVFERMKAERGKMAKEYRTAGELAGRKIIAQADREKARIEAEAYAEAQRIRAEGDAEATRLYSAAFSRDAGFYKFVRTLQTYEKIMDESTTLFLPAQSEVLRIIAPLPRQGSSAPARSLESTTAGGKGPLRDREADPAPVAGASVSRQPLQ
jgi:membrane protease subunit HflC